MTTSSVTVQTALSEYLSNQITTPVSIVDSSQNVQNGLVQLQSLVSKGDLASIALTDPSAPLTVDGLTISSVLPVLSDIAGAYTITVSGTASASSALPQLAGHVTSMTIGDSSANIVAHFADIASIAATAKMSIQAFDLDISEFDLTTAQFNADRAALNDFSGFFNVVVTAGTQSATLAGPVGHGMTVVFNGAASLYAVAADGQGSLTVTGNGLTDHLSNVTALQFSDHTEIVAQTPAAFPNPVTGGNITELYGAVFGREPDVTGLAYYQGELAANPAIPLSTFALWFLASPEYINNAAHNYAPNATGDANFINDSYTNLLHRAPEAGAVAWYQANVINPILGSATPGTAAYTTALALAHAQVLVDFSASDEFLGDVKITAQHPADAQHWLVLT